MNRSASAAVRTETRTVRPFRGLSLLEEKFRNVVLNLGSDLCEGGKEASIVDESSLQFGDLVVSLRCSQTDLFDALKIAGLSPDDVQLLVTARATTYKVSEIIYQVALSNIQFFEPFRIDKASSPLIFGDRNGFDIRVALVLAAAGSQVDPLRPRIVGTWLAKRDFRLRTETLFSGFSSNPLTDETRQLLGAPKGCMTWLEIDGGILECEFLADSVHHYVDAELYDLVVANVNSPSSKQLQTQWVIEVFCGLVQAVYRETDYGRSVSALPESSPLMGFLDKLASSVGLPVSELILESGEKTMVLQARLGAMFKVLADSKNLFRGE